CASESTATWSPPANAAPRPPIGIFADARASARAPTSCRRRWWPPPRSAVIWPISDRCRRARTEGEAMEKFTRITAAVCPLPAENIDTDQILPARYLKLPRKGEHGKVLFHDLRFDAAGNERPDFPLIRPGWRDAGIIVAGRNFGGGSSREAAVYALYDYGIRCVIAPSFGDIFSQNATKNGLLTAVVDETENATLLAALTRELASPVAV